MDIFHPIVSKWFEKNIGKPSPPQLEGWPQIQSGKNVLICAPTGTGKTLAAFLESINRILIMGLKGELPEGVFVLYISPLKALNNDINKNLEIPLRGIKDLFIDEGITFPDITKAIRTGDTPINERQRLLKKPPHILITTPESLYLMLTSVKAREMLKNVHYLIVDEIHTMLGTKRGVHLALSLERLERLSERKITRIGLSATVNPIDMASRFLGGLKIVDGEYVERSVSIIAPVVERSKEVSVKVPVKDFRVLEQGTVWPDIYELLLKLIKGQKSTLVFVNNRATAERVAANVNNLAEEEICRPHHGSISKNKRLSTEDSFKNGELRCIIATSTLELGIDVGSVDLMLQVAAPPTVSSGLQRLGRAGHNLSSVSKGYIIPKTRGDLLKAAFLSGEMLEGRIEKEHIPVNCLDILSQHIVSMSCEGKWNEEDMFSLIRQAWSYKNLKENDFKKVLSMLAGDYEHKEDIPVKPRISWDRHSKTIEGTSYSRMLAISSSGTIPDRGAFAVYLEDQKTRIGELDEEFVFESRVGDRFMLGNSPWKISRIDKNKVIVSPCTSVGAKSPFWKGDGIGIPYEQAVAYGSYIEKLAHSLQSDFFIDYVLENSPLDETGALNVRNYLNDQIESIGTISSDKRIVVEYTSFSETDNKIIIHAHFGGKVNSVLAILFQHEINTKIRSKAYTSFTNDAVLIHFYGFFDELSNIFSIISSKDVERILLNCLPQTSRFSLTFRYNAYRALMMGVRQHGKRLPLWIQRLRSVDALENAQKYMDHPLIIETMRECFEEIFDIPNTINVIEQIERGSIQVVEKKTWFTSPFSAEILFDFQGEMLYMEKAAHPGENEYSSISGVDSLNLSYKKTDSSVNLRNDAILEIVKKNNTKYKLLQVKSLNDLHSFFLIYGDLKKGCFTHEDLSDLLLKLISENRVVQIPNCDRYIAVEEIDLYHIAENVEFSCANSLINQESDNWTQDEAITRIIRRYARYNSPFTCEDIVKRYTFSSSKVNKILSKLQGEGIIIYAESTKVYYHSNIYDRVTRLSLSMTADEIQSKDPHLLAAFIFKWQKMHINGVTLEDTLYSAIKQLEGIYLPAQIWETIVFPARIKGYSPQLLDKLCGSGKIVWRILDENSKKEMELAWFCVESLSYDEDIINAESLDLSDQEKSIYSLLCKKGASFTHVLSTISGIKTAELLEILKSLVYKGLIVNDSFWSIRYLMDESLFKKRDMVQKAKQLASIVSKLNMGRWEVACKVKQLTKKELIDRLLLRYGILTKEMISIEKTSYSWAEIYEELKQMEYAGHVQRGYFFKGISGIQFMSFDAVKMIENIDKDCIVLNACDPAQVYGNIISHSTHSLPFSCIISNVVVLYCGKPVLLVNNFGGKITFDSIDNKLHEYIEVFINAFLEKRIWPDRKKIVVKHWSEDEEEKSMLQDALKHAGFTNEMDKMVLWR
ncbi:UNVERIFIED_CONTAM: ATP-dependent Lhr-like helicase [Acetivibrio alkalicellulosi]